MEITVTVVAAKIDNVVFKGSFIKPVLITA